MIPDTTDLLRVIHQYYPIGIPWMNNRYEGYRKLVEITENKINKLIQGKANDPWITLTSAISQKLTEGSFLDCSAEQFPNLSFLILWKEKEIQNTKISTQVYTCLSLLTCHYTIVIEEVHISSYGKKLAKNSILLTEENIQDKDLKAVIADIKGEVSHSFKAYTYVPIEQLMVKIAGGIPFKEGEEYRGQEWSIFRFLFSLHNIEDAEIIL